MVSASMPSADEHNQSHPFKQSFKLTTGAIYGREIRATPFSQDQNTENRYILGRARLENQNQTDLGHSLKGTLRIEQLSQNNLTVASAWSLYIYTPHDENAEKEFLIYLPDDELNRYHSLVMNGGIRWIAMGGYLYCKSLPGDTMPTSTWVARVAMSDDGIAIGRITSLDIASAISVSK